MQGIKNKTAGPVKIRLPGGKMLFLGPGKSSEISDKALEHPAVKKLVDDGTIELLGHSSSSQNQVTDNRGPSPRSTPGQSSTSGGSSSGDR